MLRLLRRSLAALALPLAFLGTAAFAASPDSSSSSPPVNIRLRAPWQSPPLLLEILEAVHTEDAAAFHPFLVELTTNEAYHAALAGGSAKDVYEAAQTALDSLGLLKDEGARQNWKMSLALHSESAKVAAFFQLAETSGSEDRWASRGGAEGDEIRSKCDSWVDWYGEVVCTAEELKVSLKSSADRIEIQKVATYPFDHVVQSREAAATIPTAVLYGNPISSNFDQLHRILRNAVTEQAPFRYVIRWKPPHPAERAAAPALTSGYLAGYGGALDLKKVDYLVIDDRKLKHASGAPSLEGSARDASSQKQLEDREWLQKQLLVNISRVANTSSLSPEEIDYLGLQAAQVVLASSDPLRALEQLTHDFPLHVQDLARGGVTLPQDLDAEFSYLTSRVFRPGASDFWVNGRPITESEVPPQSLVKLLRSERELVDSLMSGPLRLTPEEAVTILSNQTTGKAQAPGAERKSLFDSSDRIERRELLQQAKARGDADLQTIDDVRDGPITWWNDVEKDSEFRPYSPSLRTLLRQVMPGQFPQIRRNVFNIIWVFDLRSKRANRFLTDHLCPLIGTARIPLHWGFVPGGLEEGPESDATGIARLYWHLFERFGIKGGCRYFEALAGPPKPPKKPQNPYEDEVLEEEEPDVFVTITQARAAFTEVINKINPASRLGPTEISTTPDAREQPARDYIERLRLTMADDRDGHMFFNGQYYPFIGPNVFQLIMQLVSITTQSLQRAIYMGEMPESVDLGNHFYDQPGVFRGRSNLVFPPVDEQGEIIGPKAKAVDLGKVRRSLEDSTRLPLQTFLTPQGDAKINATVWIVADLDTAPTQQVLQGALSMLRTDKSFRLGFVHLPSNDGQDASGPGLRLSSFIGQAIKAQVLDKTSADEFAEVVKELASTHSNLDRAGRVYNDLDGSATPQSGQQQDDRTGAASSFNAFKARAWNLEGSKEADDFWKETGPAIARAFGVAPGEAALVVNGRLLSGVDLGTIKKTDIEALLHSEKFKRIEPVLDSLPASAVEKLSLLSRDEAATAIADIASVLGLYYYLDESKRNMFVPPVIVRVNSFEGIPAKHCLFEVGNRSTARLRFQAIVNPLAERTQRWASIFRLLSSLPDVHLEVIMNPQHTSSEMPLKRFYRFSAPKALAFDDAGQEIAPTLSFNDLPQDAVLTMGLEAPPAWLTMASEAVYDLDNILLRDVPEDGREAGVLAVYDLKQILIEGHAREVLTNNIPAGLQLLLQTPDGSQTLDTIVTANLAYFQFRARPGLYSLSIRPGKGDELYEMKSVGNLGWDSPGVEVTGDSITLDTLQGLTIYPTVKKRPGKEKENLIEPIAGAKDLKKGVKPLTAAKSFFDNLKKAASTAATPELKKSNQAELNIFTVASGHLYERMTYIMILSVLRHTNSTTKFWFIENFLSPSFKEFIPHLAKEYGFQYEMVTYAWPHWLRAQREKQRTIWGYKILFLDVLFPLDLDKVIFVDSDQVVRTDLKELTEIDLQGSPYGFPPMGDDSDDMEGYRFWKTGYWKDFLRGRPYHISALYVVDLKRFRSITAGDVLREQYHALSADPHSLSNLDQDLPQVLMDHIPIHTLDQEWLWCETWCSTDWLHKAKTIDLCSNPKTHEAKLDRARRQIPEWTELDEEVQRLARRVGGEKEGGGVVVVEEKDKEEKPASGHSHDEL
ncbi:hypothetical protein BCV69DRAFT_311378 [Microstroma glucosiphilum]|uniref:UDP-glucose:glyco protein glucosyltransferase n=1 Tax=Pseudomicrostroma glucosiphilum TaxID=1684307 RepID=A0A316UBL6_9BASI|nr:hypothetical protein BCV69DRAFT_311378 [Pseudomicrostroma glucosiphilum]PWN22586.1 hypothetical protein BCV69DRAFT_311378 [Pseudomicrostroma glucosiphilum]